MKNAILKGSVMVWTKYRDIKASFFVENMGITILAVVVIFGGGGLLIAWLKGWIGDTTGDISDNGGVNDNFGNSVKW